MNTRVLHAIASIVGAAAGATFSVPAMAQEHAASGTLQEIVVTARRREESLQDVPIAITAMTASEMEDRSINNIHDMSILMPNVTIAGGITTGNSSGQFVMRGIPGVSRYMDGVVQQTGLGALINIVELERVEVLRGPQGTLFGKNAIGGAIQYITQKPRETFGARLQATLGSYDRRDFIANVDIPLGKTLFAKVTGASLKRDGFVDSDVVDVKYGEQNNDVVRGQLAWRPTKSFEALFTLERSQVDEKQQANVLYDVIDNQTNVIQYRNAGFPFSDATHAYGAQEEYRNRSNYTGPGNIWDSLFYAMDVNWHINDALALRFITGGRDRTYGNYQDLDASEYAFFEIWNYAKGDELSQEVQLLGSTDRLNFTTGLYYANDDSRTLAQRWQYEEVSPRPTNNVTEAVRTDYAIFGEATWRATDRLSLTAGLRYTKEDFENEVFDAAAPRPAWQHVTQSVAVGSSLGPRNEASFHALTPRVSIQFDWTPSVMTYLTYSEGFNGGGVNGGTPINGVFIPYTGETLRQYELGLRSDLLGETLRLNANVFKGYWDDIQVGEVIVPGQITIQNGGAAEIAGAEVDLLWRAGEALTMNLAGGWLDTRYTELGNTQTIRLDSEFAYAPRTSFSAGAAYEWRLGTGARVRLRGDYGWVGKHMTINDIRLQKEQDAYGLLSARLTYTSASGRWDAALSGTNLTNEWYRIGGFSATLGGVDQGVASRPRELALSIGARF